LRRGVEKNREGERKGIGGRKAGSEKIDKLQLIINEIEKYIDVKLYIQLINFTSSLT